MHKHGMYTSQRVSTMIFAQLTAVQIGSNMHVLYVKWSYEQNTMCHIHTCIVYAYFKQTDIMGSKAANLIIDQHAYTAM